MRPEDSWKRSPLVPSEKQPFPCYSVGESEAPGVFLRCLGMKERISLQMRRHIELMNSASRPVVSWPPIGADQPNSSADDYPHRHTFYE